MALNAIVRSVEVIGEAAGQVSPELREAHPEIPWAPVIGMRNRLIHAYFDIDHEILHRTVLTEVPALMQQIHDLFASDS